MLAMMIWFPLRPDPELAGWLWSIAMTGTAAGISAGLSFGVLNWLGWRLSRGPLLARAALLGCTTVLGSHLLVGLVYALLLLPESFAQPHRKFDFISYIFSTWVLVSFFSALWMFVTLPLGVAVAMLVEWLERRREAAVKAKAAG